MLRRTCLTVLGAVLLTTTAFCQTTSGEAPRAFVGAYLLPVSGPPIEDGVLVVAGGRIQAIGPRDSVVYPRDAEVIDATGWTIIPGLVDTHSHIGGIGAADGSGPIQPGVRVLDSIDVRSPGFRRAVAGGITTVNVMPGSGHLSSGQTVYLKLRAGRAEAATIDELFILDAEGKPSGGLKMANGTNPQRDKPFPGTRGRAAYLVRKAFVDAAAYREKMRNADADKRPGRDLDLETLVEVLEGKRVVHHHTHRADDIMTVLRLREEFGFRVVLHHVSEAWKVADEIAAAGVPCSAIVIDSPGGKLEARELSLDTGAVLEKAGVDVAFHTDDWITDSRVFLRSGALSVRAGMSRAGALEALTLAGARMLDYADRVGSLEVGKDADFVVLDGDPFALRTRVQQTWVEGKKVFDLSDPVDRLHADGGYGAGEPVRPYLCCTLEGAHQ